MAHLIIILQTNVGFKLMMNGTDSWRKQFYTLKKTYKQRKPIRRCIPAIKLRKSDYQVDSYLFGDYENCFAL